MPADGGTHAGLFRVLFDGAHKQVAGNADWIVDSHAPDPQPANPTSATQWNGGISSWGFGLYSSGRYSVKQLPAGAALNFGGGGDGDLSKFDVFISDEPGMPFSAVEQSALVQFAQGGGGIFLVSDHSGAVRCSTCTEAWKVINAFLDVGAAGAFGVHCDGNSVGAGGLVGTVAGSALAAPIGAGPFGQGHSLSYHSGSTVSLTAPANAAAGVVVSSSAGGMMAISALPSGGRLVLLGDSSPTDDGTCACGAALHAGWTETDDSTIILNATAWLARD